MPSFPILEKPTAVAAATGWYVVTPFVDLEPQSDGYVGPVDTTTPEQVQLELTHVVAWRIDFTYQDPDSADARPRRYYGAHAWPGFDMATPITLEGHRELDGDILLKAPDGRFIAPHTQEWDDEQSLRLWYLEEVRARVTRMAAGTP